MRYAIIDQDGDCVDKGYETLDSAIKNAKRFLLLEIHPSAVEYQLFVHKMDSEHVIVNKPITTITLNLDWTIVRAT